MHHFFCSQLVRVRDGANLKGVRVLAGHASVRTTGRYVHATREDLMRTNCGITGISCESSTTTSSGTALRFPLD